MKFITILVGRVCILLTKSRLDSDLIKTDKYDRALKTDRAQLNFSCALSAGEGKVCYRRLMPFLEISNVQLFDVFRQLVPFVTMK